MKDRILLIFSICCIIVFSNISINYAQENCAVLQSFDDGSYQVEIDGKQYRAISEDQMQKILKLNSDLKTALAKYQQSDSLLKDYDKTIQLYDTTFSKQKKYITELESVFTGYKDLLKDYKKFAFPTLTFEGGVGVTGGGFEPAVLAGFGFSKVHVWGLLQNNNSGVLIGTHFIIF